VHQRRVQQIDTSSDRPRYCVEGEWRNVDFVVLASERATRCCRDAALSADELEMTQAISCRERRGIIIKFLPEFEGYIGRSARRSYFAGICGSMAAHTSSELRSHLHQFASAEKFETENAKFYSHVLPSPQWVRLPTAR